jgi:hypothetical protein|tara:strand:+ start:833 stop:1141 length:309 start_codon:yes stop_codon:yes gene_type:complete
MGKANLWTWVTIQDDPGAGAVCYERDGEKAYNDFLDKHRDQVVLFTGRPPGIALNDPDGERVVTAIHPIPIEFWRTLSDEEFNKILDTGKIQMPKPKKGRDQ